MEELHVHETGGDARFSGGTLTIDLREIEANYRALARLAAPAGCAAVVKADAYGLGAAEVAPALAAAGCETFFVATPDEGVALRAVVPSARIFVFNGLFGREAAEDYARHGLIPVINSRSEAAVWEGFSGDGVPCALNVDTGMNRLGLTAAEALALAEENALTGALDVALVMSHLACADRPRHPMNRQQLEAFAAVRGAFAGVPASLANSAGILLGREHHFELVRPGIALYGGAPSPGVAMRQVVTAAARIAQIRHARAGEAVSYGATTALSRDTIIAVASVGYADGYPLSASRRASGFVHGRKVPILGRVTMDLTMFDVTDLGEGALVVGDTIELFGRDLPLDEAATAAGTISYELLTRLGRRYHRTYIGAEG